MKKNLLFSIITTFLWGSFLASTVMAIPVNRVDFPSGPDTIDIDFDGLSPGLVTTQYQGSGVIFSGGAITYFAPNQVLSVSSELLATFSANVNWVGLDFENFISPLMYLEAYDNSDNLIESVSSNSTSGFLGISTPDKMISYIKVHDSGFAFSIDNLIFVDPPSGGPSIPVPEPATMFLLGSGLLGLGLYRRRRGVR